MRNPFRMVNRKQHASSDQYFSRIQKGLIIKRKKRKKGNRRRVERVSSYV